MFYRSATALIALAAVVMFGGSVFADQHLQQPDDDATVLRASKAIGLEVQNKQDEEIGEIDDLIVNAEQGAVTHVLVSSGGFLGIGDRLLPIPLSKASFGEMEGESDEWRMVVDLPRRDVEKAPAVEDNILEDLQDDQFAGKLHQFYRVEESAQTADAGEGDLKRASELIGKTVMKDVGEEELGEINDLVFAANDGKVRYAALSFGGFLGFGDKLFAVPWDALALVQPADEPSETQITLTADVSKETLRERQGFTEDEWPRHADMRWAERVAERREAGEETLEKR